MTSAQRGRGGPKIPQICGQTVSKFCGQREGRVKKSEKGVPSWKLLVQMHPEN